MVAGAVTYARIDVAKLWVVLVTTGIAVFASPVSLVLAVSAAFAFAFQGLGIVLHARRSGHRIQTVYARDVAISLAGHTAVSVSLRLGMGKRDGPIVRVTHLPNHPQIEPAASPHHVEAPLERPA
jgi:hypothetical protein